MKRKYRHPVDEDLKKAEEAVNALLAKRQRLTVVSEAAQSRENNISNIIIDNMFKQRNWILYVFFCVFVKSLFSL